MDDRVSKNQIVVAGLTTVAMTVAVIGHMFAIDWLGRKLQNQARRP